ncbi:DNA-binding transcriptional regulator (plasmid) [Legionella adelaidensis]|uniref:Antitoxin HipB n=1 Tax=Legionella adelaidensis TaxID=45056 RepID=A0A0W0R2E9_9GAMM|nr:helix-turn-helix transcriptional regulator [Legionella adelaidensis]KTC65163.1 antitoxin HipB [Legionella adelaidensis]VEH85055.1 DNA-binding transcriptional regulator [Legionella adelaidensis]
MEQLITSLHTLGTVIKRRRKAQKLTQTQAGIAFNIDQGTLSSIEQGAGGTRLTTLFRVLAALDLEMVIRPKKPNERDNEEQW